jgi:hypothetical protein
MDRSPYPGIERKDGSPEASVMATAAMTKSMLKIARTIETQNHLERRSNRFAWFVSITLLIIT